MPPFHRIPAMLAALALTTALAGCSVSVVDGTSPSADTSRQDPTPARETDPPSTAQGASDRASLIAAATRTVRCDGEYALMDDAIIVRVEGACDHVIVNASGSQLVIDDAALVEVIGSSNVVLAGTVQTVRVNGNANVVHWTGATPTVSDIGSANTLTAG